MEKAKTILELKSALDTIQSLLSKPLAEQGITWTQLRVFDLLLSSGPTVQRQIAAKLGTTGGNVTVLVDGLEEAGWAKRSRQAKDRRLIHVDLTEKGRKMAKQITKEHTARLEELAKGLSDETLEHLVQATSQLAKNLESSNE